jgi:DNA mismatch repair protein PMS2
MRSTGPVTNTVRSSLLCQLTSTRRFEVLQQSVTVHKQPLISPRTLETTPAVEAIIMENIKIFEANGFNFLVNETKPPGHKLQITTLPFAMSVQFDENDIHEFASLLESVEFMGGVNADSPGEIPNLIIKNSDINQVSTLKLPRLVSLLASRACRTAVMVGTSLSLSEMKAIVTNMSSMDQPWNCPHGRPTLRYLTDVVHLEADKGQRKRKFLSE